MPVWHERTLEDQKTGKLQLLGIIQEQHPDRCRLFMQWKGMDWPILVDSLNRLGVEAVPITLLIDEFGVIRSINPRPADVEIFLEGRFERAPGGVDAVEPLNLARLKAAAGRAVDDEPGPVREYADALVDFGGGDGLKTAIGLYERLLVRDPDSSVDHFRLGVAYRKRFDSGQRVPDDFGKAVRHWSGALRLNPNQYIWRRRIQQYGPRLDKPYPFYDWVPTARDAIRARNETPLPLIVEPGGAEFAAPRRQFDAVEARPEPPGADRIRSDDRPYIHLETTVVPSTVNEDGIVTARVHLDFRPNRSIQAHWNNEAEGLRVWIDPPAGWSTNTRLIELPNPAEPVSVAPRHVEFEIRGPAPETDSSVTLTGYALYYVCEDVNGVCLYRKNGFQVRIGGGDDRFR